MRVIIAKSLINQPKFIMFDEPTIGLDPDIALKMRDQIEYVNKEFGTTILLTSHYMAEVERLCKRIAFIDNGRIVDMGDIDKVKVARFSDYLVEIKVRDVKNMSSLKKNGFSVTANNILQKRIRKEEDVSEILNHLVKEDYVILNVQVHHPTLEDYFLKMTEKEKYSDGKENVMDMEEE